LRSFHRQLPEFDARGIRVVAISADTEEATRRGATETGFAFPILADPKTETISRYGLLHQGGGPNHSDIARPAEFLLDSNGKILWENFTESVLARVRPEQVLKAYEQSRGGV
jgi:peroxiredoxin